MSKFDVMRCGVMLEREREWVKMCEKEYAVRDPFPFSPLRDFESHACPSRHGLLYM